MKITSEQTPRNLVYPVVYEDRLNDLEFATPVDRDHIDKFWSSIYISSIAAEERLYLAERDDEVFIRDISLFPSDYDLKMGRVGVMLAARIELPGSSAPGPVAMVTMDIDGSVIRDSENAGSYSDDMRPYVRTLLSQTALHYDSLDTPSLEPTTKADC